MTLATEPPLGSAPSDSRSFLFPARLPVLNYLLRFRRDQALLRSRSLSSCPFPPSPPPPPSLSARRIFLSFPDEERDSVTFVLPPFSLSLTFFLALHERSFASFLNPLIRARVTDRDQEGSK